MKKILILIAMLCMSIGSASASDFDYHLSNVPHPMLEDIWTIDWNTLTPVSPSETDNMFIEHILQKIEQVATVDCYTETEDGQREVIQKKVYLYQNGGIELHIKESDLYASTDCLLKRDENNLTTPSQHLPLFMSGINNNIQSDEYLTISIGTVNDIKDRTIHLVFQEQNGQVHEGIIASVELLNSKTDKDVSVRAYKDPDLDRYDGGFAFNVEFTNNTNKPLHKYYALLSYQSKLWNFQNQNWALSEIHFFDAEIPANGVFETGISTGAFITQNNIIWIEFDSKNEMEQMKNSYPRQQTNNGYLSDYERDIDSGEVGQKWLKDTFGIEFTK